MHRLLSFPFPFSLRTAAASSVAGWGMLWGLAGCGNPGSPLPPSLMLPQPVGDLQTSRLGDTVSLRWTMPSRSTDRVRLRGDVATSVCRAEGAGACESVSGMFIEAGKPAEFVDRLPPELCGGRARLLRYEVRLRNRRGLDGGPSNPAWALAGAAPPAVTSASAEATAGGIALRWMSATFAGAGGSAAAGAPPSEPRSAPRSTPGATLLVRLQRDQVPGAGEAGQQPAKEDQAKGVPQPMQQVLEARETRGPAGWTPDRTVDAGAVLNRSYRYTVQLVERAVLDGHAVEAEGLPAQTPVVDARDRFAPATPGDLAAVSNAEGGTIDLAWNAGTEGDLAGYFVYRRVAGSVQPPARVSGDQPVASASWTDPHPAKGARYSYSVSAVDRNGNESARSGEVVEGLPE